MSCRSSDQRCDDICGILCCRCLCGLSKMKLKYPVTLQVNVKNLFDKTYYTSSIATNNPGNQIGDPREVQFAVKMAF